MISCSISFCRPEPAPLALEFASELGHIDVLVCSVGTGGHSAGVSRVLRQLYPELTVVGVDTTGSTSSASPPGPV
jgi:cysteine synthase A